MKKRLYAILITDAVIVSAAGCNQKPDIPSTATETAQTTTAQSTSETAVSTTATEATETTTEAVAQTTTAAKTTTEAETSATAETTTTPAATSEETTSSSAAETTTTVSSASATTTTTISETQETTTEKTTAVTEITTSATTETSSDNTPVSAKTYEAEDAELSDKLTIIESSKYSGGKAVENFGDEADNIVFTIDIPETGMYDITFVSSGIGSYKENNVIIDGTPVGIFKSENEKLTESVIPSINLSEGSHSVKITKSWGWIKLDCIKVNAAEGINDEIFDTADTLINKNANEATKSLFRYLSESYGKYIISGQVCDDGYYGREFTAIYNETGKRPAILGLDMMDYTPSRTALGARSNAVETAVEFADMGGIVTFCWHWNAPTEYLKSGKDSDNGNPRWWGGFYTRNSTFDIAKVMNGEDPDGKAAIDRDIEEIAKQLKRLDNAGVPVLWRPLHEASGGWFWWGTKGADAYKKLWVYLYEELTYKYECNNLIWVFNAQNSEWYPGDEYVDIVGEDIYPGQHVYAPQTAKFKEAAAYSTDNKIVALTENGCIFDIEQAVETNTMWAWFCTWGGEFAVNGSSYSEKYTEKEILKKVYDSEYVISFDELPDIY